MRCYRVSLLAFSLVVLTFGQQGNGPRLGLDAPSMGYKEVPEWPIQVLNAAARPAARGTSSRWPVWRSTRKATSWCCTAALTRSWNSKATGSSCVPGATACSAKARSARSQLRTACPVMRSIRRSMDLRDAIPAVRTRFAWTRNTISGLIDAPGYMIYKMDPQGKVILQLGHKGVAGAGHNTFNLPTDVALAPMATSMFRTVTPATAS